MRRAGWALLAGSIVLFALGWWSGYAELAAFGVAGVLVLVAAAGLSLRRPALQVERRIEPDRVPVGGLAEGFVTVTNHGRGPSMPLLCREPTGRTDVEVAVPRLGRGRSLTVPYPLPTARRAVVPIGPLQVIHGDPFGLMERRVTYGEQVLLHVHPRHHRLTPADVGRRSDLESEATGGNVGATVFHALREYVIGDDLRRVHWKATAHTGELMVREYVDPAQPDTTVVLDERTGVLDADDFEVAVEAAASVAISELDLGYPVRLVEAFGAGEVGVEPTRHRGELLDRLAAAEQRGGGSLDEVLERVAAQARGCTLVVITGAAAPDDLVRLRIASRSFASTILVSVGTRRVTQPPPGVRLVQATDAADLVAGWAALS